MYKYNFFCFVVGSIGACIAFFIMHDVNLTILNTILAFFNYYLYQQGK